MKGLCFPQGYFLQARRGSHPSWGRQSLIVGRNAISPQIMWAIRNGKKISIKDDKWLKKRPIGGPK